MGQKRQDKLLRLRRRYVSDCISALNLCAGYRSSDGASSLHDQGFAEGDGEAREIQAEVEARVASGVDDFMDFDAIPKQQEAFRALLRGRSIYDITATGLSLASYTSASSVSLPVSTHSAPLLTDIAPDEALHFMNRRLQRMLRPLAEYERLIAENPVKPYRDRTLRGNRREYVRFVRTLYRKRLVLLLDPDRSEGVSGCSSRTRRRLSQ